MKRDTIIIDDPHAIIGDELQVRQACLRAFLEPVPEKVKIASRRARRRNAAKARRSGR